MSKNKGGKKDCEGLWLVFILEPAFISAVGSLKAVKHNYEKTCWILVDDKRCEIWIVPRELEICGRKLEIKLK